MSDKIRRNLSFSNLVHAFSRMFSLILYHF